MIQAADTNGPLAAARVWFREQVPSGRRELYVSSATGSDRYPGTSPGEALRSIDTALERATPGTRVIVSASGKYGYVNAYAVAGTPNAWITIEAAGARRPIISVADDPGSDGIDIQRSSFVGVFGLEIVGRQEAEQPGPSGVAVFRGSHHVALWDLHVHDFPGGGINCFWVPEQDWQGRHLPAGGWDCVDIWFAHVHGCSRHSPMNTSGISLYGAEDLTGGATIDDRYGARIIGPLLHDIECTVAYECSGLPNSAGCDFVTDGNGISIDSLAIPYESSLHPWRKPVLVESPIIHGCGGRAIHVFDSTNVDICHPTATRNLRTISPAFSGAAEIEASMDGVTVRGGVLFPRHEAERENRVIYQHNVFLGGGTVPEGNLDRRARGAHYLAAGPLPDDDSSQGLPLAGFVPVAPDMCQPWERALGHQAMAMGRRSRGWSAGALEPS